MVMRWITPLEMTACGSESNMWRSLALPFGGHKYLIADNKNVRLEHVR